MTLTSDTVIVTLGSVLSAVIIIVGFLAGRYLSERIGIERYNRGRLVALDVIKQVEQEFRTNKVAKDQRHKKAYALILRACPWLNADEIDSLILASLASMKIALGEWAARAAKPSEYPLPAVLPAPPQASATTPGASDAAAPTRRRMHRETPSD